MGLFSSKSSSSNTTNNSTDVDEVAAQASDNGFALAVNLPGGGRVGMAGPAVQVIQTDQEAVALSLDTVNAAVADATALAGDAVFSQESVALAGLDAASDLGADAFATAEILADDTLDAFAQLGDLQGEALSLTTGTVESIAVEALATNSDLTSDLVSEGFGFAANNITENAALVDSSINLADRVAENQAALTRDITDTLRAANQEAINELAASQSQALAGVESFGATALAEFADVNTRSIDAVAALADRFGSSVSTIQEDAASAINSNLTEALSVVSDSFTPDGGLSRDVVKYGAIGLVAVAIGFAFLGSRQ